MIANGGGRPQRAKHVPVADASHLEPLTVRVSTAVQITGISRSRLYELIQSGDLETVKLGRSTLIPYWSLKALTGTSKLADREAHRT